GRCSERTAARSSRRNSRRPGYRTIRAHCRSRRRRESGTCWCDATRLAPRPMLTTCDLPLDRHADRPAGPRLPRSEGCGKVAQCGGANRFCRQETAVSKINPNPFTTRPEIEGTFGVVTSTHWIATAVGMAVLEKGGNAFDAGVATAFTLQVVEPHLNGPGGDVPVILYDVKR